MNSTTTSIVIEPEVARHLLGQENVIFIDLCQPASYIQNHVPGAVYLDYNWIVMMEKPRMGLLPDEDQLSRILNSYGIGEQTHVIAYDDEGGGRAGRLLWTLQCIGHRYLSLLNGGLHAWAGEGMPLEQDIRFPKASGALKRNVRYIEGPVADKQYILEHLDDENTVILDARSPQEYNGTKVFAARGGHIPGAINYDWVNAMDRQNNLKLKDSETLKSELAKLGVTPDKTIVCHCQSHHRSAHTCIMLNSIGFEKVKGYPGSWSDWGNDPNTPVV
jgi:thiosulfate/3-mercaptopyruvate sulfurtransferase